MDFFKIFTISFMILILYYLNQNKIITENFDSSSNCVDDWNAINQLGQISRQLMAGGVTVPGALTVTTTLKAGATTLDSL